MSDTSRKPVRVYRMSGGRRALNVLMEPLVRAGVVPGTYLLTTVGRKTGLRRTVPVTIVDRDGRRWLVAPYGPVGWVHNARAAGRVTLSRRGHTDDYTIREADAAEAGPVLKQYVGVASVTRPYFSAAPDSPAADFSAEADRHPVFELRLAD